MEMITLGIFLFALFTRKDVGISDENDLFEKTTETDIPIKTDEEDSEASYFLTFPDKAITID
jgi:hypothetical protein